MIREADAALEPSNLTQDGGRRGASASLRVALVGGPRFGVEEPLAGGMESLMMTLAVALASGGAEVSVFAGVGSERRTADGVRSVPLLREAFTPSADARADVSMPSDRFMAEHHAFLHLATRLRDAEFDVVHNHSLHYLPPVYDIATPMVHTLHSPPTPWLESAHACRARSGDLVVSVSSSNASRWGGLVSRVIPNGVDVERWARGRQTTTSDAAVWMGRIVPEKAPHLAIEAARLASRPLQLVGPIHDRAYFDEQVGPRLGGDVTYHGHLGVDDLARLVGGAAVVVVTPAWDEPFGLVVAEALAAGTPVAAFARGGICEILDASCGVLAPPDDVPTLAVAIERAAVLDRDDCQRRARSNCSVAIMAARYTQAYQDVMAGGRTSAESPPSPGR